MSSKPFSVLRAIDNDFKLTTAIIVPLILWTIYILSLMVVGGSQFLLILAVIGTLVSPVLLTLKLRALRAVFERGEEVTGEIHKVYFHQDRGRIDYSYTYAEQKYSNSIPIHRTKITKSFEVGQRIQLVVDRDHSDQAYILDLYS
jgi:hypothetical protein